MTNINLIQLSQHELINPTSLACNMMTLYAPLNLLGLPCNQLMHHLPTSDITRPSQDQIKLGINNTVAISKWPQGAWFLPMTLVQQHEYTSSRYPRYHRDPYGDHNPTNTWSQTVILKAITTRPTLGPSPFWRSQPTYLIVIKHIILITVDSWCDLLLTRALIRGGSYR